MQTLATGTTGTIGKYLSSAVKPIKVDLSQGQKSFMNIDIGVSDNLIHLAGIVGNNLVCRKLKYAKLVNVRGTKFLAREFLKKSVGKFVYVSSCHVYASSSRIIDEEFKVEASNEYTESKIAAERVLLETFSNDMDRLLILRPFSVLDWCEKKYTLGGGITRLASGDKSYNLENIDDVRDFLTPRTLAEIIELLCRASYVNGILNVCTGTPRSVKDAALEMFNNSGLTPPLHQFKQGVSIRPMIVGNSAKLEKIIQLKPKWTPSKFNSFNFT